MSGEGDQEGTPLAFLTAQVLMKYTVTEMVSGTETNAIGMDIGQSMLGHRGKEDEEQDGMNPPEGGRMTTKEMVGIKRGIGGLPPQALRNATVKIRLTLVAKRPIHFLWTTYLRDDAHGEFDRWAQGRDGPRPMEKMVVPTFDGTLATEDSDLGATARSYLRQVAAWQKMTRASSDRQGLLLYQALGGKAGWKQNSRLGQVGDDRGLRVLHRLDERAVHTGWEEPVGLFRRLKKREWLKYQGLRWRVRQSLCQAGGVWVHFARCLCLEEASELNLLASVGNIYNLKRLQQASIVQGFRKPWEGGTRNNNLKGNRRECWNKRNVNSIPSWPRPMRATTRTTSSRMEERMKMRQCLKMWPRSPAT